MRQEERNILASLSKKQKLKRHDTYLIITAVAGDSILWGEQLYNRTVPTVVERDELTSLAELPTLDAVWRRGSVTGP